MVTCNGYRNPALMAKMASTVDVLSHGRLDFGIGAGWYEHEYRAYGYGYLDAPERLRYLRESVQLILAMWTQDEAVFEGKYYHVHGAINQPKGVQKPHIPLLIGGGGEQVTLKLVAQYGDACNIGHLDNEGLERKFSILKKHCEDIGRDYNSIKRTVLFNCAIAETDEEAMAKTGPYARNIPSGRVGMYAPIVGDIFKENRCRKKVSFSCFPLCALLYYAQLATRAAVTLLIHLPYNFK
jgi:alkanesulfonate monooxygenase SsuD/methylene tetrahydromethanopterin reductase-like flavin-dependent oxidoreductase (luciferase family)